MKKNSTKVWIFILSTSFFLLLIGYNLGDRLGLLLGFFAAIALNALVFIYGETHLLSVMRATRLQGQDPWGVVDLVTKMSAELGLPLPSVYITPHRSVSAFCVGRSWQRSSLCFTTGLLQSFSREELEAVVAHQLCHIRRMDTFAFSVSSTLANSIVGIGQFLDSLLPLKKHFFMNMFSPIGWLIIKFVVGQKTFFENDLMASQLIEDRSRFGRVLWRLEGLSQTQPLEVPPCTSHLFIVNPEGFGQRNIFLKSHPSIERRIQKLLGYYPI